MVFFILGALVSRSTNRLTLSPAGLKHFIRSGLNNKWAEAPGGGHHSFIAVFTVQSTLKRAGKFIW